MDLARALEHVRSNGAGVLATLGPDGSPQVSVVFASVVEDRLWISSTQDRIKTRNLRLDPRATFVSGLGPWAAIEGRARIRDGDGVLELLRLYYRTARGEHPDWEDYDRAMVEERRLIIDLAPERAYGVG